MGALAIPVLVLGTALNAYGKIKQAKDQKKQGRTQRRLKEDSALVAISSSQYKARSVKRQTDFIASRALAVAAASGADASGTQITNIIADIEGEGAYRAALELYQGEESARMLRLSGFYDEKTARQKSQATKVSIFGDVLSAGAQIFSQKGKKPD